MSERFKTLYRISENLYSNGSPLIIAAGALLKDNQTGKVLAQLKLKSISDKSIKAVKIRVLAFDVAGASIGDAVEHQYLDLKVNRNDEFGSKEAVPLTLDTTRSFSAQVLSVIFSDGSIWDAPPNAEWNKLLEQKEISDLLNDGELVKQYILETGGKSKYVPVEADDFWLCSCGAINHKSETNCVSCKKTLPSLIEALDISILTAKKNARIEKDCTESEVQAQKFRIINKLTVIALIGVLITVYLCYQQINDIFYFLRLDLSSFSFNFWIWDALEYLMELIALSLISYFIVWGIKYKKLSSLFWPCLVICLSQLIPLLGERQGCTYIPSVVYLSTTVISSASYIFVAILFRKERGLKISGIILLINLVMSCVYLTDSVICLFSLYNYFIKTDVGQRPSTTIFIIEPLLSAVIFPLINVVLFLLIKNYPKLCGKIDMRN